MRNKAEGPAADARKAKGASCTTFWMLITLCFTGSEAWDAKSGWVGHRL